MVYARRCIVNDASPKTCTASGPLKVLAEPQLPQPINW